VPYLQNLVADVLGVQDMLGFKVDVGINHNQGSVCVLESVSLGPLSQKWNTVAVDEGNDLLGSSRFLGQ
jgi:hypothetical protein